jgi:hypothetical protein
MNENGQPKKVFIYQIFYDEASKGKLDPGFIPMDNTDNARPDWYEFWSIRNFLNNTVLDDDAWYGFLSPRFLEKTGITSSFVLDVINNHSDGCDIVLFSYAWDQLAYFRNPFEQGDIWHPGLSALSQSFFDGIGLNINVHDLVTYSSTSVFSNYLVAKPSYWYRWLLLANAFFDFSEMNIIPEISDHTSYVLPQNKTPMKTFIQERLASVILSQGGLKVLSLDRSQTDPVFTMLFDDDIKTRRALQVCDFMKEKYCLTQNVSYLDMYYSIKKTINIKLK